MLAAIESLLKERMGLDAASIGTASVGRAVQTRLDACGLRDASAYWDRLAGSEEELQELIETVVVGETWFFRDREAFTVLLRAAREEWLPAKMDGPLRVLSLPCSTGEEPFSIAMALLDGGVPAQRFHIDGVDISARALARAGRALYGRNSFRGEDIGFRDRYFERDGAQYRLSDTVRGQVRLKQGNLLASGWLPGAHAYEAIFCRNVLIYFDRPTQERALDVLSRLLAPRGLLFVGPAESVLMLDRGFVPVAVTRSFAFRKPDATARRAQPKAKIPPAHIAPAKQTKHSRTSQIALAAPMPPAIQPPPRSTSAQTNWIEQAQKLANEGKLMEAMQCCDRHLREEPASAEAFYLIGLLHDAAHHPHKAAEYYRKAVYLDPRHREAMVHLAVVLQNEGDRSGAQQLFERAKRIAPGAAE